MILARILWNILLPIFLVAGVGWFGRRRLRVDGRTLSTLAFYVLTPSLVFTSLFHIQISLTDLGRVLAFVGGMIVTMALLGLLIARLAGWDRALTSAFVLTLVVLNNGNYGIPLNRFAFGDAGSQIAVMFYAISAFFSNTLGVLIATSGHTDLGPALKSMLRVPMIYATAIAIACRALGVQPPAPVMRAVELLADAAVPVMLLILGVQLSSISAGDSLLTVMVATGLRLVVSPIIAVGMAHLMGLQGMTRVVGIVQWGVPTAVIAAVLATQYDCKPTYVAMTIFATTLMSIVTMPLLLGRVAAGMLVGM